MNNSVVNGQLSKLNDSIRRAQTFYWKSRSIPKDAYPWQDEECYLTDCRHMLREAICAVDLLISHYRNEKKNVESEDGIG